MIMSTAMHPVQYNHLATFWALYSNKKTGFFIISSLISQKIPLLYYIKHYCLFID